MTENVENLILEQLRLLRNDIATHRTETRQGFLDLTSRVNSLEHKFASVDQRLALLHEDIAIIHRRLDHHEDRLARIERRLELREEPQP